MRLDLTDKLTFWFKPTVGDVAADFVQTLADGHIAGTQPPYMLGDTACVAFTEIPLSVSAKLLQGGRDFGINYAPVGFLCDRRWLFEQGARPVIYQSEAEAELLPPSQRYRHVTLDFERGIDFTWKREWRLPQPHLKLVPQHCHPVLPSAAWLERARTLAGASAAAQALLAHAVVLDTFV
ncbi:hypothetical protein AAW51_4260 [Caldimonas brevitalea]|uniref:Uncharacterized protein n=1 Tax=Caldimonas brevitalea TaxID=413882 RepID=A0A0G3BUB0_9BURK|nr:hypothetical protein AAW51_4260 [Caldimonas brevitalea]